jgi:phospholipase D1/2
VKEEENAEPVARMASETGDADAPGHNTVAETEDPQEETDIGDKAVVTDRPESMRTERAENGTIPPSTSDGDAAKRRPAQGNEPFEKWEREEMGKLLEQVRGHLGKTLFAVFSSYRTD